MLLVIRVPPGDSENHILKARNMKMLQLPAKLTYLILTSSSDGDVTHPDLQILQRMKSNIVSSKHSKLGHSHAPGEINQIVGI